MTWCFTFSWCLILSWNCLIISYKRGPKFGCVGTLQRLVGISEFGLVQGCIAVGICGVLYSWCLAAGRISTEGIVTDIYRIIPCRFNSEKARVRIPGSKERMISRLHFLPEILPSFANHIWGTAGRLFNQGRCYCSARQLFVIGENLLAHVKHWCRFFWVSFMTRQRHWHKQSVYIIFAKFPHKFAILMTSCSRNMQFQPNKDISNTIHYSLHSTTVQVWCSYWGSSKIYCFYKTRRFISDAKACLWTSGSSVIQNPVSEPLVHQWSKSLSLNLCFISDPKACPWPSGSSVIQKPASEPLFHQLSKSLPLTLWFICDPKACLWTSGSSVIQKPVSEPLVHQWSKSLSLNLWFVSDPKACLWTSVSSVIQKPAPDPLVHLWSKSLSLNLCFISDPKACLNLWFISDPKACLNLWFISDPKACPWPSGSSVIQKPASEPCLEVIKLCLQYVCVIYTLIGHYTVNYAYIFRFDAS